MAVQHVYSNAVADGTATSVVRPSDWNSYHNQYMTLGGNTAGQSTISGTNIALQGGSGITLSASTAAGAATIVVNGNTAPDVLYIAGNTTGSATNASSITGDSFYLAGGNNVTLSNNNGTVFINGGGAGGGVTDYMHDWQPFGLGNSSNTSVGIGTLFFCPINAPNDVACTAIEILSSNSISSTNQAWSKTYAFSYGFFIDGGTGTNSSRLELVASSSTGMTIQGASSTSFGFTIAQGTNSATYSTANSSHSLLNAASWKVLSLPFVTTLTPGADYYYFQCMRSTTAGANPAATFNQLFNVEMSNASLLQMTPGGVTSTNRSKVLQPYGFINSVTVAAIPSTVAKSNLSIYSNYQPYLYFHGD